MRTFAISLTSLLFLGCTGQQKREGLTDGGTYYIYWDSIPGDIPFNDSFKITAMIHDGVDHSYMYTDKDLFVDATMPAHGHGMDTTPEVTKTGGLFQIDGMLFHMAGDWELVFAVSDGETVEKALFNLDCCDN